MRNRNAGQASSRAFSNALVGFTRLLKRHFGANIQKAVQFFVRFNTGKIVLCQFDSAHFARGECMGKFRYGAKSCRLHSSGILLLLDNLRHEEQTFKFFRSVLHVFFAVVAEDHLVFAQTLHTVVRMHHRLDPFRVDSLNPFDHFENIVQFGLHALSGFFVDANVRKLRNTIDIVQTKGQTSASFLEGGKNFQQM